MSYESALSAEINRTLDMLIEQGQPLTAKWIAHSICEAHSGPLDTSEHSDFWRFCGYEKTRDTVRRLINLRAGDKEDRHTDQFKLPGYEHLQAYYMVRRNGDDVGIPIAELTDGELTAKAALYRTMAVACRSHANELDRYRQRRATPEAERPAA